MPIKYVARKCNQCAGMLEYIKDKKTWKCLYCGAEIERAEQYDGLFTIKNVVRQVLLDVAYRRLDSAEKNLVECEKIDSRYIGTIIAKIAYQMIAAITPSAYPQTELRNVFSQVKRNYETLCAIDKNISGDEEALYEFFDNADVYATLLLVYDSLNDIIRRDYVAGLLSAKDVYAKEPNKNLLSYALKNTKYDLIDDIMRNPDNVEPSFAFSELLQKYPDNENKIKNIERLLKARTFKLEDKEILESYLADSSDCIQTKGNIIVLSYSTNIRTSLENVIVHLLSKADHELVKSILHCVCSSKLNDDDVYKIIEFAISTNDVNVAMSALTVLKDSRQYVTMTSKCIIAFLSRRDLSTIDKTTVLTKMFEFNPDVKTKNAIITNYLCFNEDTSETRLAVIPVLLKNVSTIQTNTIENYILSAGKDGMNKPDIVEQIFSLDLNISFFNELLTKYIGSTSDPIDIKDKIVTVLANKGLKIDPNMFINYICHSHDSENDKVRFVKKMLQNGAQMRGDTVNAYLEKISSGQFNPELFALIIESVDNISERALSNYLLYCKDSAPRKARTFITLIERCGTNITDIRCDAMCAGQRISGNILTVYVLATPDSFEITKEISDFLIRNKLKINADIFVSDMGIVKFKKFISVNQIDLSTVSSQICEAYKY
jgi:hypothetical protein